MSRTPTQRNPSPSSTARLTPLLRSRDMSRMPARRNPSPSSARLSITSQGPTYADFESEALESVRLLMQRTKYDRSQVTRRRRRNRGSKVNALTRLLRENRENARKQVLAALAHKQVFARGKRGAGERFEPMKCTITHDAPSCIQTIQLDQRMLASGSFVSSTTGSSGSCS